jgi:DNA polymerase elongation subunit (family B)
MLHTPRRCEVLPVCMDREGVMPSHLDQLLTQRQAAGKQMPR